MKLSNLPLELEWNAAQTLSQHYPNRRFNLQAQIIDKNLLRIDFKGYCTQGCKLGIPHPNPDPISEFYRDVNSDFWIFWSGNHLALSAWWRHSIFSLEYNANQKEWVNEDGEVMTRPYPDGDDFEKIAVAFYPILEKYFPFKS